MASGVQVSDDCLTAFQNLKLGKKAKYIIFKLSDDLTKIVVEKHSTNQVYDDFTKDLPENECRWAVYDFEFTKEEGGKRNKIFFIAWSPDEAKIKQKMVFASSRDALRRSLVGIALEIQATSADEVSYETVLQKASLGR